MVPLCLHQETRNNFQVNGWLLLTFVKLARETTAQSHSIFSFKSRNENYLFDSI
jgi:hypothetical protein